MEEESRRPKSHAAELGEEEACRIVRLKTAHPHWGARKIRELYRRKYGGELPSESSFKRVMEKAGLTQKKTRRKLFNTKRPHEALNMATPSEVYSPSERAYKGTPEKIDYAGMETRQVPTHGKIAYLGHYIPISTALAGWNVGLHRLEEGLVEVWFAKLLIGQIDPDTASFKAVRPPPKKYPSRRGAASFWPSPLRSEGQKDASLTTQPKPKKL